VLTWQQEVLELARFDGFWLKEGRKLEPRISTDGHG
jgi:hypothetical protein